MRLFDTSFKERTVYETTHFPGAKKYWFRGELHDWSETTAHPMSHAFHYGTSTFEGIRAYKTDKGPAVFRLPEHIDRFLLSASILRMTPPCSRDEIMKIIHLVMKENGLESAYIRPLMFYSYGNLGLIPKACPAELLVGAWRWDSYFGDGHSRELSAYILPRRRVHHSQLDMRAKLGGVYVQSTICGLDARSKGFDEAIFLNIEGRVAEGPGENIFLVRNGELRTNDISESILEGITRTSIIEIARESGYNVKIGPIAKEDLFSADEVFFTGTAVEITPVVRITDGSDPEREAMEHPIGGGRRGPVSTALEAAFKAVVSGRNPKYAKWLTPVV